MKFKIFSLPIIISGLALYGIGYNWGAIVKQNKVVAIRLDQKSSDLVTSQTTLSNSSNSVVANDKTGTTSVPKVTPTKPITTSSLPAKIPAATVKKNIPTVQSQQPAAPAVAQPTQQPVAQPAVTQPAQPPVANPAPVPTTKVS